MQMHADHDLLVAITAIALAIRALLGMRRTGVLKKPC
jgi:hypothetical protein